MFALSDKKALVTGASGGIGAIAGALHAQGATLALAGRQGGSGKAGRRTRRSDACDHRRSGRSRLGRRRAICCYEVMDESRY